MQKLLKRAARARKSADSRSAARKEWHLENEKTEIDDENKQRRLELRVNRIREAKRRKEDYLLGPMSPWRQNMANMLDDRFGVMNPQMIQNLTDQRDAMQYHQIQRNMLRVGDRVAIMRGHRTYRNQIGEIKQKGENRAEFTVESIHRAEFENNNTSDDDGSLIKQERYIPAADLALVYPLPNPRNNNIPEDCIISLENLHAVNIRKDPFKNNQRVFDRMIRPQNIIIPWPKETEPAVRDYDGDTLRIDSEAETHYPRLTSPPMPASVLDELRNKYSKMRRRHEQGFLQKLHSMDTVANHEIARGKALLPGAGQPRERPARKMSNELANAIGEWMVAKKAARQPSLEQASSPTTTSPPS